MSEQLVAVIAKTKGRGSCRSCGARLTWYTTHPNKKGMPFDGDPVPRKSEHVDGELIEYMSADDVHWRTCPDAPTWKRDRR